MPRMGSSQKMARVGITWKYVKKEIVKMSTTNEELGTKITFFEKAMFNVGLGTLEVFIFWILKPKPFDVARNSKS